MKKNISILVGLMILVLPFGVMATDDVSMTAISTQFVVNGYTLVLNASNRTIDSVTVDTVNNRLAVTLAAGRTFGVKSADKRDLAVTPLTYINVASACTASESSVEVTTTFDSGSQTFYITPSSTLTCETAASSSGGSGGGASGGGGGGGGSYSAAPAAVVAPAATITTAVPATQQLAGLQQQLSALLTKSATQVAPASPVAVSVSPVFTKALSVGSKSSDVTRLQTILAADKEIYPEGTVSGYFGALTKKAVQRFQVKYGVAKQGDVGYGNFGPATRAKMKVVYGEAAPAVPATPAVPTVAPAVPATPAAPAVSNATRNAQVQQLSDLQKQLELLLKSLKK